MKKRKILSSLLAGVILSSCMQGMSSFASNGNVYLDMHYVQDNMVIDNTNVKKGDIYIDVDFKGFSGITSVGLDLEIGSGLDFITDANNEVLYETLNNDLQTMTSNGGKCFWTTASSKNRGNGTYLRIYLRPNANYSPQNATANVDVELLTGIDKNGKPVTYIDFREPGIMLKANEYIIGDTDNDGRVDSSDASNILSSLSNNAHIPFYIRNGNPYYTDSTYTNWFPNAVCMDSPDADQSEVIDEKDAEDIMSYYGNISAGREGNPVDEKGNHLNIGEVDIYEQY